MSLSFPTSPQVGQVYQNWLWNGSAWISSNVPPGGAALKQTVFTATGTWTPMLGMVTAMIECIGGGGGGAGSGAGATNVQLGGGGGGSGGYSKALVTAAQVGASQAVTIGAGGTAGTVTPTNGGAGGATYVGTLCRANGGGGGINATPSVAPNAGIGANTTGAIGDLTLPGADGGWGGFNSGYYSFDCRGGATPFFGGPNNPRGTTNWGGASSTGIAGTAGSGGSGGVIGGASQSAAGGVGGAGLVVITEYGAVPGAGGVLQSGQRILLARQDVTAAVATVVFTPTGMTNGGFGNSQFDSFELEAINFSSSAAGVSPGLQFSEDGGTTWVTTSNAYGTAYMTINQSLTAAGGGGPAAAYFGFGPGLYATAPYNVSTARISLWRPWASGIMKAISSVCTGYQSAGSAAAFMANSNYNHVGGATPQNPITAVRFMLSAAGNYTAGTFKVFGVVA